MANGDYVNIESFHDPFDGRIIRYRYERADFSIYSNSLLEDEIKEIQGALEILRRFDGMPQMEWIRDLCSRFDVSINTPDKPVVEFLQKEPAVDLFLSHAEAIVAQSIDKYLERHFTHLSVAFGCTGGQHRSVYCAERLANWIRSTYPSVIVDIRHREQD